MIFHGRLERGIILGVALVFSVVLLVGIWRGTIKKERREEKSTQVGDAVEAEMKLTDMEYTEMQEGRRIWTLRASEAVYYQDEQKSILSSVHLTFFFRNGEEAQLESRYGILYAGTKNIELWDAVRATLPRGYQLDTDKVFYEHQREIIHSESPITVSGPDGHLTGRRWQYKIREHKAEVVGGVEVTLVSWPPQSDTSQ